MKTLSTRAALAAGVAALAQPAAAKVVKFEVLRIESPAFEGRSFGTVGTYDRIVARATIAVAPSDPHNSVIVDIDRAPRNAQGLVEATTDVEILRPTVAANGNRRLIYDVVNRGSKRALAMFNDPRRQRLARLPTPARLPDEPRLSVVWSGWQGDLGAGGAARSVPTVAQVSGLAREFIFDHTDNPATAALSYPRPTSIPRMPSCSFASARGRAGDAGGLSFKCEVRTITLTRPAGFDGGAIYELVYQAKDPKVMALGLATTRDLVSFLRHEAADASGTANTLAGRIDRAIGFGQSQSGRYLHDFLYYGFNGDEAGRPVFDGLMPHLAGGKKTFTNFRFSQPGRSAYQHADTLYPGAEFPFTYPVTTDALTGKTDGMLARCLAANNCPRIVKTDTELEFYQDAPGWCRSTPRAIRSRCQTTCACSCSRTCSTRRRPMPNPRSRALAAIPPIRSMPVRPCCALLVALDQWITDGTQPPASRYPSRADGTLAEPSAAAVGFPAIPGVSYPSHINRAAVIDETAMCRRCAWRRLSGLCPEDRRRRARLAGLKLPTLEAPIATHTGWNLGKAGFGEGELCDNTGSMLPFAKTREERMAKGDPRLSLAERYPQPGDRAALIERAARKLVADRLLLEEDVPGFLQATN
jgi:hypothetical protein